MLADLLMLKTVWAACLQAEPILSRAPQGKMPALINAFRYAITSSSAADDPLASNLKLRFTDPRISMDPARRMGDSSQVCPC